MKMINSLNKKNSYFEGWYFKHQNKNSTIIFIPAYHINDIGKRSASLQIITKDNSDYIEYSFNDLKIKKGNLFLKLGNNIFSQKGIRVDITSNDLVIKGIVNYSPIKPLKYNAMGPFCLLPFMKCNHGVISLTHRLSGELTVNNQKIDLTGGTGYIEKDWGESFPDSYLWTQCNWHDRQDCSIMLSIADIPFLKYSFSGCICVILYRGIEYRLATYLGIKILKYSDNEVIIQQGSYRLEVKLIEQISQKLMAPVKGVMKRTIFESPECKINYKFFCNKNILFNFISCKASFEICKSGF